MFYTDEISVNGDKCIEVNKQNSTGPYVRLRHYLSEEDIGKTVTVKVDCNVLKGEATFGFWFYNGDTSASASVYTKMTASNWNTYTLTATIPDNCDNVDFRVMDQTANDYLIFLDNFHVSIQ